MLLSKLQHLKTIKAEATNVGVVPESELVCEMWLCGCPLVSPPIVNQDVSGSLTTKSNRYFTG